MQKSKKTRQSRKDMLSIRKRSIPSATSVSVRQTRPSSTQTPNGIRVKGAEIVADIAGSVSFASILLQFNPGLASLPWLSNQAIGWEKYKVRGLKIRYVPSTAVTTTTGSVYLAFDYDATDGAPATIGDLSTYATMASGRTFESFMVPTKPSLIHDSLQWKYVRGGGVAESLRPYDAGIIVVSTVDMVGTAAIGRLWLEYDIEFVGRQVPSRAVVSSVTTLKNTALPQIVASGTDENVALEYLYDGLGSTYDTSTGVVSLPEGNYVVMVNYNWLGNNTGANHAFWTIFGYNIAAGTVPVPESWQETLIDPDTTNNKFPGAMTALVGNRLTPGVGINVDALGANSVNIEDVFVTILAVY